MSRHSRGDVGEGSRIGVDFRRARERAGLTLQEISARTKIRESFLEAIERDEFEQLPGGLLRRGFLRAFAHEVRLDPEEIVQRYWNEFEADAPGPESVAEPAAPLAPAPDPARLNRLVTAAVVVMAILFVYLIERPDEDNVQSPESGQPSMWPVGAETGAAGPSAGPPLPEEQSPIGGGNATASADAVDGLTIEIHPTGVVWVQASADGTRVLYALVYPNERHVMHARRELVLRVGDAGAFQYSVNGVRGRPVGGRGEVREIRVTPENSASFQAR